MSSIRTSQLPITYLEKNEWIEPTKETLWVFPFYTMLNCTMLLVKWNPIKILKGYFEGQFKACQTCHTWLKERPWLSLVGLIYSQHLEGYLAYRNILNKYLPNQLIIKAFRYIQGRSPSGMLNSLSFKKILKMGTIFPKSKLVIYKALETFWETGLRQLPFSERCFLI